MSCLFVFCMHARHSPFCGQLKALYSKHSVLERTLALQGSGARYVIAEDLLEQLQGTLGLQLTQLDAFPGSALEGCEYRHPLATQEAALDRTSPVVIGGDYITTDAGTGLVHTAPGHGLEDYQVSVGFSILQE